MRKMRLGLLCLSAALALTGAARASVQITGATVNLREGPGLDYATVGVVEAGKEYEYLDETKADARGVDWYHVKDGWVSSRYAVLAGDDRVIEYDADEAEDWLEVSGYYRCDLKEAAAELGLSNYENVQSSEVSERYFNDSLRLYGNELVEGLTVSDTGYKVYGAACGMPVSEAARILLSNCLNLQDEEDLKSHGWSESLDDCVFISHPSSEKSYVDVHGADGRIILYAPKGIVLEIDWDSYTG